MLRVTLLGNLGADPDLRFTAKGAQAVVFNVAVNQIRRGPDGERQENTEWFRIHVSGPKAEYAQRLTRGNRVMVIGRLTIGHYTSKDGEARTSFDVWADELETLGPRPRDPEALPEGEGETTVPTENAEPVGAARKPANGRGAGAGSGSARTAAEEPEDLPF